MEPELNSSHNGERHVHYQCANIFHHLPSYLTNERAKNFLVLHVLNKSASQTPCWASFKLQSCPRFVETTAYNPINSQLSLRPPQHDAIVAYGCSSWCMQFTLNSMISTFYLLTNVAIPPEDSSYWVVYLMTNNRMPHDQQSYASWQTIIYENRTV